MSASTVTTSGQRLRASLLGLIVRGPMVDGRHAFVLVREWLGERSSAPIDRDRALAELARRYLVGHGPASDRDLANWAGIGLRDARAGLEAIAGQLEQREDGLVDLAGRPAPTPLPSPRLLGPFDPLLHGWPDRTPILGDRTDVVTVNGIFKAIALVKGRAVATWTRPQGKVELSPFAPISTAVKNALVADGTAVNRFLAA